jgi:FkbM family methyltransferase
MLNAAVGSEFETHGKMCILTRLGAAGDAVYGPYETLPSGYYAVEFNLGAAEDNNFDRDDLCAWVDVAADFGRIILAREDIRLSRLRAGPISIQLAFHNEAKQSLEFRVGVSGCIPLLIEEHRPLVRFEEADADYMTLLRAAKFPDASLMPDPVLFRAVQPTLRYLYENGATIKAVGNDIVVTIEGVSFYVRERDDLAFVQEIFLNSTYNVLSQQDCCVIDIGMNIGLASLMFATKPFVKEIHSFEPFEPTYARARANLSLNPAIAHKISANNFGLSDKDETKTVQVPDNISSGSLGTDGWSSGRPHNVVVRDAAAALAPIIAQARRRGRPVIAKVDCEGSEYRIFKTLQERGLLGEIAAFMVEWHWIGGEYTLASLTTALEASGFIMFDLTHREAKQGLFYAVRAAPTETSRATIGQRIAANIAGVASQVRMAGRRPAATGAQSR